MQAFRPPLKLYCARQGRLRDQLRISLSIEPGIVLHWSQDAAAHIAVAYCRFASLVLSHNAP